MSEKIKMTEETQRMMEEYSKNMERVEKFNERLSKELNINIPLSKQAPSFVILNEAQQEDLFNFIVEEGKRNNRKPTIKDYFNAYEKFSEINTLVLGFLDCDFFPLNADFFQFLI